MKTLVILLLCLFFLVNLVIGQTWTSMNSPTGFKNVRDLTINSTGNNLYAADEVNLIKSNDGGVSWSSTTSVISSPRAVTCKWDNSNIVLVSGSDFFRRTTDGGSSWTDITVSNKPTALASFTQHPNVMLLGRKYLSTSEGSIHRSVNAGSTWTRELSANTTIFDIAINTWPDSRYAVAASCITGGQTVKGLYHTVDTGKTWTARMTGTAYQGWTAAAVFKSASVDAKYGGTSDGKLFVGPLTSTTAMTQLNFPSQSDKDTIRAIRIDPNNPLIVYVATDRTIYKTTNGGASLPDGSTSFTIVSTGMMDSKAFSLEINPTNSNVLIAGSRGYIYRTTNQAASWSVITNGTTRTLPLYSVSIFDSQKVWSLSNDLMITCTYNGTAWSTLRLGAVNEIFYGKYSAVVPKPTTRNIFQMGVKDNTSVISPFYYSQDDGSSYNSESQFNSVDPGVTNVEGLIVDPGRSRKVYAYGRLQDGNSILRQFFSSDSFGDPGKWVTNQSVFTNRPILTLSPRGNTSGSEPYNSQTIYAGSARGGNDAGLWRTLNAGANWFQVSKSTIPETTQVNASAWNPIKVPDRAYAGTSRGLYWSDNPNVADNLVSFSRKWPPEGASDTAVKRILIDPRFTHSSHNSAKLFWVASNNTIYRSDSIGTSPVTVNGNLPSGTVVNDIRSDPSDTTRLYIATDRGIYKAQLVTQPNLTSPANGATNILFCIDSTENLKFQWSAVTGATSYNIQLATNAAFSSPIVNTTTSSNQYSYGSDLVCSTQYYWRVRSVDGFGNSPWSVSRSFTTSTCYTPQLATPTLIYPINGSTGHEKCLTLRWNSVSGAIKYRVEVIGYYTTHVSDTIYWGCYNSNTWYNWKVKAINCNSANPFSETWSFKIRDYGGGTTSLEPPGTKIIDDINEFRKPTDYQLAQNYPNPFNPITIVNYQLPIDNWVTLKVYDVLGREVATLIDEFQVSGYKSVEFDASRLTSGVYFYRFQAGTFTDIKKMLVTK